MLHSYRRFFPLLVILLLSLFLFGCASPPSGEKTTPGIDKAAGEEAVPTVNNNTNPKDKAIPVTLYFGEDQGYLVPVKKEITGTPAVARAAMQELCRGPAPNSGLNPTIPPGTTLKDIKIKNGLATVDFSRELKTKHWGGSTEEMLTVYSIVDTLTQFPTIKQVQILVEGKRLETLAGHMDISQPVGRDGSMIRSKTK